METKHKHTSGLLTERTHPILEIFYEIAQLKNLYRQGWLNRGIPKEQCESVAEHSFGVGMISYFIAAEYLPDLDPLRAMRVGLFHELGEIDRGDITPRDGISPEEKFRREYEGVQKVFRDFPNAQRYIDLWLEYEKQETPESRLVRDVDRLEMAMQAGLYERLGYSGLDEFFPYVEERIQSSEAKSILEAILKLR